MRASTIGSSQKRIARRFHRLLETPLDTPKSNLYKPRHSRSSTGATDAQVAQLVEHATENRSVAGSIPALGTIGNQPCQIADVERFNAHSHRKCASTHGSRELRGSLPRRHRKRCCTCECLAEMASPQRRPWQERPNTQQLAPPFVHLEGNGTIGKSQNRAR